MFTKVHVYNDNDYSLCGDINETLLLANKDIVVVNCTTPLVGNRVRLEKYDNHKEGTTKKPETYINICEVFVIGYLYAG